MVLILSVLLPSLEEQYEHNIEELSGISHKVSKLKMLWESRGQLIVQIKIAI